MKQAILSDHGFEVREVPRPACEANGLLVKTVANGVCSGEVHRFVDVDSRCGKELIMGHEGSGVVVEVGRDVTGFNTGDNVTTLGGPFAEYISCTPDHTVRLADTVDPLWALGEPVACCVHAMNRARIKEGCSVALVGCGFMGLVCLQLARAKGAERITAVDAVDGRLEMARQLGADETLTADQISIEKLNEKYGRYQGEYDVVLEAVGNQSALDACGYLVKQHGLINLIGHHQSNGGKRNVFIQQWNVKAIDVINGHVRLVDEKVAAMREGMKLASEGKLILESLVATYPLDQIEMAFNDAVNRKPGIFKPVIIF